MSLNKHECYVILCYSKLSLSAGMGWRDDFIFIFIMQTGNTSEIGLVFLMYGLGLFLLRNFCCLGPFSSVMFLHFPQCL